MHPKEINIADYHYELANERIAKYPANPRDESKLLVYKDNEIFVNQYKNIAEYIPENTLLIFNDTRVIPARLLFNKVTGGEIELFCLEPDERYKDITSAMLEKEKVFWKCLVGGAKKWKAATTLEKILEIEGNKVSLYATMIERQNDTFIIEFNWSNPQYSFAALLDGAGVIPLPPYLNRAADETDKTNYQTIYATHNGSVAAPTGGLHFTEKIFQSFIPKNIQHSFVTLHVGAGTFKPVTASSMQEHEMHSEFLDVSIDLIDELINYKNIIPVGTTSLRTIESLYWIGVKIMSNGNDLPWPFGGLSQWDAYELPQDIQKEAALSALKNWMIHHKSNRLITKTQLLIAPSYQLRIANALVTNFHQPHSTLLLLVAAVVGKNWRNIYEYALENDFRFLSYGDGSLLFPS